MIDLKNMADHTGFRKIVVRFGYPLMFFLLLAGLTIQKADLTEDVPNNWLFKFRLLKDPLKSKWTILKENHNGVLDAMNRTLGIVFAYITVYSWLDFTKLKHLSLKSQRSFYFLTLSVLLHSGLCLGTFWNPDP